MDKTKWKNITVDIETHNRVMKLYKHLKNKYGSHIRLNDAYSILIDALIYVDPDMNSVIGDTEPKRDSKDILCRMKDLKGMDKLYVTNKLNKSLLNLKDN